METSFDNLTLESKNYTKFVNEFWTAKQRQANSIHEISYRACYKPQLPRFFIDIFTEEGDTVYDPFAGRGTTLIEAALMGRQVVSNDVNPLSAILTKPRLNIPSIDEIKTRLDEINFEVLGSSDSFVDTEIIFLASEFLKNLELNNKVKLYINSLGDLHTLSKYKEILSSYFNKYKKDLSNESQTKIETNPLRILDSKDPDDIEVNYNAPTINNYT